MRNSKTLVIEQLDKKLKPFLGLERTVVPENGWIPAIRTTMNITLEQLGNKLNMTKQGVKKMEERALSESISIKSLKEIGNAMEMQLVYGFVPKQGSIEKLIEMKAENLARKIVLRTNQNMKLENQGNSEAQIKRAIKDLTAELKREMPKSLWD